MPKKLSSKQAGTLGELLSVAKLNSLGFQAYMSPEGAPGHDLMVVVGNRPKSVEVKTRQFLERPTEISRWPVNMNTKSDADFFVLVEIDLKTLTPTFYVLSNAKAKEAFKNYKGGPSFKPSLVRKISEPNDFSAIASA